MATAGQVYFHWIDIGTTQDSWAAASTWDDSYAVYDEQVASIVRDCKEGQIPTLTVVVRNPRVGLLTPGRPIWAWVAWDNNGTPEPLFFGRLIGLPTNLFAEAITLVFTARSINYIPKKQIVAEGLKTAPNYDPIFLDFTKRDDPDAILGGWSKLYHVDQTRVDDITASDILIGEDGTVDFTPGLVVRESVTIDYKQPANIALNVVAKVSWTQASTGYVDLGLGTIYSYSGDGIINDWPKPLSQLGGGWSVAYSDAVDAFAVGSTVTTSSSSSYQNTEKEHAQGDTMSVSASTTKPVLFGPSIFRTITSLNQIGILDPFAVDIEGDPDPTNIPIVQKFTYRYVPLWKVNTALVLRYDAARSRTEILSFTLKSDTQAIITDALVTQNTEQLTLTGADVGNPILQLLNWSSIAGKPVGLGVYIFPDNPTLPGQTSIQVSVVAGVAGTVQPIFSNVAGDTTTDGSVTWSSLGASQPPVTPQDWTRFTLMPLGQVILPRLPISIAWATLLQIGLQQVPQVGVPISLYQIVQDTNGNYQLAIRPGETGIALPQTGWSNVYGGSTLDGTVTWACIGPSLPLGNVYFLCTKAGGTGELLPPFQPVAGTVPPAVGSVVANPSGEEIAEWTCLGQADVPVGGYPGATTARSFFPGDRGLKAIEYLLCRARAQQRLRARAVEISWECPFEMVTSMTCRMNAVIEDPNIPGGLAAGKVIEHVLTIDGNAGVRKGKVTIGCSIGLNNVVEASTGEPVYSVPEYAADGYQYNVGEVVVLATGDDDLGYTPPADAPDDDGLVFPLTKDQVVLNDKIYGLGTDPAHNDEQLSANNYLLDTQMAAINDALDIAVLVANQATAVNGPTTQASLDNQVAAILASQNSIPTALKRNPVWREFQLKNVNSGPFIDQYSVETSPLALPMTIDLGGGPSGGSITIGGGGGGGGGGVSGILSGIFSGGGSSPDPIVTAFFISHNGSDSADGSITAPFLTVDRAIGAMTASSTIKTAYVRSGLAVNASTMALGAGQHLLPYPSDPPLSATVHITRPNTGPSGSASNVLIKGLLFTMTGSGAMIQPGDGCTNLRVQGNSATGSGYQNFLQIFNPGGGLRIQGNSGVFATWDAAGGIFPCNIICNTTANHNDWIISDNHWVGGTFPIQAQTQGTGGIYTNIHCDRNTLTGFGNAASSVGNIGISWVLSNNTSNDNNTCVDNIITAGLSASLGVESAMAGCTYRNRINAGYGYALAACYNSLFDGSDITVSAMPFSNDGVGVGPGYYGAAVAATVEIRNNAINGTVRAGVWTPTNLSPAPSATGLPTNSPSAHY